MRIQSIDQQVILDRLFQIWQSIGSAHPWQQDIFMLMLCLVISVMVYLSGTVLALFIQSLWGILAHKSDSLNTSEK